MKQFIELIKKSYTLIFTLVNYLQSPFILSVRMYWAGLFSSTGYGKIGNILRVMDFFPSLNVPYPLFNVYLVAYTYCVGGAILFAGLASRIVKPSFSYSRIRTSSMLLTHTHFGL